MSTDAALTTSAKYVPRTDQAPSRLAREALMLGLTTEIAFVSEYSPSSAEVASESRSRQGDATALAGSRPCGLGSAVAVAEHVSSSESVRSVL
jgi:hypothetical protein